MNFLTSDSDQEKVKSNTSNVRTRRQIAKKKIDDNRNISPKTKRKVGDKKNIPPKAEGKVGDNKNNSPKLKKLVITPVGNAGRFKGTEGRDISPDSTISNDSGMLAGNKNSKVEAAADVKLSDASSNSMCSIEQQLAEMGSPVKDSVGNRSEATGKSKQTYFILFN